MACGECLETCIFTALQRFSHSIGPALIALALGLIMFCSYVFFAIVIVFYSDVSKAFLIPTGVFILFNALYNYYKAVTVSPGIPPLASEYMEGANMYRSALAHRLRNNEEISDGEEVNPSSGTVAVCSKCERIRRARTHHCSVCRSCILKYDHHCPWIYNCVGLNNYKYFYLFLLHVFLVDLFFLASAYPVFHLSSSASVPFDLRANVTMAFLLAFAIEIALLAFLSFHTYMILTNQTTMEWATGSRPTSKKGKPFDSRAQLNWSRVFGETGYWKWAFSFLHTNTHYLNQSVTCIGMVPLEKKGGPIGESHSFSE